MRRKSHNSHLQLGAEAALLCPADAKLMLKLANALNIFLATRLEGSCARQKLVLGYLTLSLELFDCLQ